MIDTSNQRDLEKPTAKGGPVQGGFYVDGVRFETVDEHLAQLKQQAAAAPAALPPPSEG